MRSSLQDSRRSVLNESRPDTLSGPLLSGVGRVLLLLLLLALGVPSGKAGAQSGSTQDVPAPHRLLNTVVEQVDSRIVGQTYELYISLPRGWEESEGTYPVLYMLDAGYSFAIAWSQVLHFADRGDLPPMILVAISYPDVLEDLEVYRQTRTRDYTPSFSPTGGYGREYQRHSGGADRFLDALEEEILPLMEGRYRASPEDRGLVGHSYGGLFATHALLTRPGLSDRYIIVSPSYWYDDGMIFDEESERAASGPPVEARVFLAVGSYENQPGRGLPMVDDLRRMAERLRSRDYPDLSLSLQVFEEETHNSVFPAALTRGLRAVYP